MADVVLPALGESVTEGTVTRWLKKIGDTVGVDEPLVEISTDKVDTEIPSPVAGVVQQILVQEDETVAVGAVLAVVAGGAAIATPAAADPAPTAPPPAPVVTTPVASAPVSAVATPTVVSTVIPPAPPAPVIAAPVLTPAPIAGEADPNYVTPIVRKLASDLKVNLAEVRGTGVGGRIRKEDVEAAGQVAAAVLSTVAAPQTASSALRGTTEPMSRLRRVLAERAVASMQQTAQLTSVVEVDVTNLANLRDRTKNEFLSRIGVKLSFTPFFTLAAAEALGAHPKINSSAEGEQIVYHEGENISFAVDTERGLLTPVIRNCASLTIAQLAKQIADLADRTRNNQLKPDELAGGTFTVTNTGSRGALFDTPVVFLPQSAILGTGFVTKRPAVVLDASGNEAIAIRSMVYLALSYDHRIIDGADAARYLTDVKGRLEEARFEANLGI
jgi:2-oxoglutarate dehydrogenase E2 component (dihydrolipoamide succinyltransferase)